MNFKVFVIVLVFTVINSISAFSQASAFDFLDTNNVKARVSAIGTHFWDLVGSPAYEVPKGSGKHTLFSNSFWIGGKNSNGKLYLSGQRYVNDQEFTFGPLSTDGSLTTDQQTIHDYNYVWLINKAQIEQHIAWAKDSASMPNYSIPQDFLTWPAHGDTTKNQSFQLAPFVDQNNNGIYEPQKGDYPKIRGDQAAFFMFNDAGIPNGETSGTPLGVEIHAMAYAFSAPNNDAFHNTIFMHYKIINRSSFTYEDTYLGLFTDFGVGHPYDDYIQSDVQRGSFYSFNGEPIDGAGNSGHYGANPPAQSITLLGGPYLDSDGIDNPAGQCDESINGMNFGNNVIDDERLGMTRAIYFNNIGTGQISAMTDPEVDWEYYNYLQGRWKDSSDILYGGNGHMNSGAYGPECRFMFPGDSDTCNWGTDGVVPNGPEFWTEETAGNMPYDKRGFIVSGPFTFAAGTSQDLDFAFVYGRDTLAPDSIGNMASVDKLKENIDSIRNAFYDNKGPHDEDIILSEKDKDIFRKKENFKLFPNPANNSITIKTMAVDNFKCIVYDIHGKALINKNVHLTDNFTINISGLPKGIYLLRLLSESKNIEMNQRFVKQ